MPRSADTPLVPWFHGIPTPCEPRPAWRSPRGARWEQRGVVPVGFVPVGYFPVGYFAVGVVPGRSDALGSGTARRR